LLPLMWETHSTPEMGERPQAVINRQVLCRGDLLVAVFWTRIGTPTGSSPSGTVEEIRNHLGAGKPALIYFSRKPVELDSVDHDQYGALKQFREECKQNGLIAMYDSLEEFSEQFSRHLEQAVRDHFPSPADQTGRSDAGRITPVRPAISPAAK